MDLEDAYIHTIEFSNYCKVHSQSEIGGTTTFQSRFLFWTSGTLNIFGFDYPKPNSRKVWAHKTLNPFHLHWNQKLVVGWDPSFLPCPWESAKRLAMETCFQKKKNQTKKQQNTALQPSISMNIFHNQTIKASGLSIRLKAVKLLAKRDVSVSHNLMYTFRQFHGSLSSSSFFFIWDPFQPLSLRSRFFIWLYRICSSIAWVVLNPGVVSDWVIQEEKALNLKRYSGFLSPLNWLWERAQERIINNKFEGLPSQHFGNNINMNSALFLIIMKH